MNEKFIGTTVNERLFLSGLTEEFDRALQEKNPQRIKDILLKVELPEESIIEILQGLGLFNSSA